VLGLAWGEEAGWHVQEVAEQHVHEGQQEVLPEGQLAKERPLLLQDAPLWMHHLGVVALHVQQV